MLDSDSVCRCLGRRTAVREDLLHLELAFPKYRVGWFVMSRHLLLLLVELTDPEDRTAWCTTSRLVLLQRIDPEGWTRHLRVCHGILLLAARLRDRKG